MNSFKWQWVIFYVWLFITTFLSFNLQRQKLRSISYNNYKNLETKVSYLEESLDLLTTICQKHEQADIKYQKEMHGFLTKKFNAIDDFVKASLR